jgi:hypothetical protein
MLKAEELRNDRNTTRTRSSHNSGEWCKKTQCSHTSSFCSMIFTGLVIETWTSCSLRSSILLLLCSQRTSDHYLNFALSFKGSLLGLFSTDKGQRTTLNDANHTFFLNFASVRSLFYSTSDYPIPTNSASPAIPSKQSAPTGAIPWSLSFRKNDVRANPLVMAVGSVILSR